MYLHPSLIVVVLSGLLHAATSTPGQFSPYGSTNQYNRSAYGPPPTSTDICTPSAPTKRTFPTSNEGCFPNMLINGVQVDPFQRQGVFYEFRSRFADVQVYNTRLINSVVCDGSVYLPGTYTPAVHFTQDYRYISLSRMHDGNPYPPAPGYQYNYGPKVNCSHYWLDFLSTYDGIDNSNTFSFDNGKVEQSVEVLYYLFSKPGDRGFEIQYGCLEPNQRTYDCDQVQVYVFTRVNPSQMTDEENDEIEDTIDRVLAPYCMSKNDLQKVMHRADLNLDQCDMPPPEAFTIVVNGYTDSLLKREPSDRNQYDAQN